MKFSKIIKLILTISVWDIQRIIESSRYSMNGFWQGEQDKYFRKHIVWQKFKILSRLLINSERLAVGCFGCECVWMKGYTTLVPTKLAEMDYKKRQKRRPTTTTTTISIATETSKNNGRNLMNSILVTFLCVQYFHSYPGCEKFDEPCLGKCPRALSPSFTDTGSVCALLILEVSNRCI